MVAPTIIPASALGRDGNTPPSERITLAAVGWGMQGPGNTEAFMREKDCQVLAACDLDKNNLETAVNKINSTYSNQDSGIQIYSGSNEIQKIKIPPRQ